MRQVNEAVILHFHQMPLRKFWRQCFGYGRGACTFHRLELARGHNSLVGDSGLHLNLLRTLWPLWLQLNWKSRLASLPLLGVWQLANVCGFVYQRRLDGSPQTLARSGAASPPAELPTDRQTPL